MKKITLNELLHESKYQKTNIKVGSKSGSSFWYCGKGDLSYSIPAIRDIRKRLMSQCKSNLYQLKYRQEHLDQLYETTYKVAVEKRKIKDIKAYKKTLDIKKERERQLLPKKIASAEYDLNTHLLDREVREIVYGICPDETPCWIIYVKGNEKGAYWTIEEYNKRRKNYDN